MVVSERTRQCPNNDDAHLPAVADAEFDNERKHRHVRDLEGADSVISTKRGKKSWNLKNVREQMR